MKQYILSAICAISTICVLFSCTDDDLVKKGNKVVEGIPTEVKLSFAATTPTHLETKSALLTEEEFRVSNLYLFVFNAETGKKEYGHLFTGDELGITSQKQADGSGETKGEITVELLSGAKRIYAIANVPNESSISSLKTSLDEISDVNGLLSNEVSLIQQTYLRSSGNLLMTGVYGGTSTNGGCTIDPAGTQLEAISLKRVDARITFNIGIENGSTEKKFTPKKWQVFNLPKHISLVSKESDIASSQDEYFGMNEPVSFETTTTSGQSSFTFYMWENRKSTQNLTVYQEREMQDKTTSDPNHSGYVVNGAFVNAPANSTYVVLTGDYYEKYTENGVTKERTADVTYTVHLGYAKTINGYLANDFNTERNTTYIYNVSIKNVNDIRLEVTSFKEGESVEPSPGAEGNIVETDKFYPLDAHFEQDIIVFNQNAIEGKAGFKLKTPFQEGYFSIDGAAGSQPISAAKDYKWVHFIRHEKNKRGIYKQDNYQAYKPKDVMDIAALLSELKEPGTYDSNGNAVYTMFVDEFYYQSNPMRDGAGTDASLWKKFVNQPNREMHILCNTEYSQDRESSLTTSSIMISQRSIKTFYNENASGLSTAWGIETINETGKLTPPDDNPWNRGNLDKSNGRWNFFSQTGINNQDWDDYISTKVVSNGNHLKSGLSAGTKLVWACLQRNRDENGNGAIDATEVKWYPASINQYTDIWVGKDALPVEAHLFPNGSNEYWRYLSSNGKEFYAEEGAAINDYKFLYANSLNGVSDPTQYDYRCVRNLGMSDDKPSNASTDVPQDYVSSYDNGRILYPYINGAALRGEQDVQKGEFAVHTELDPANRPYVKGFEYKATENMSMKYWKALNDEVSAGSSPCAKYNTGGETGWRLPNERELSLMSSRLSVGWTGEYQWARTTSSLSGKKNLGYGGSSLFMSIPGEGEYMRGRVRCVRDIY